jgi:cob(I)alamin adenosyltransferase
MPHYTRSGDDGHTTLYGGGRVPKHHQQPETYGAVDEATSAFGLARSLAIGDRTKSIIEEIQRHLYLVMAELATAPDATIDRRHITTAGHVDRLESIAAELEADAPVTKEFILPGETPAAAALDVARTTVRRAERETSRLMATGHPLNPQILRYLNRTSSVAFDLARYEEHLAGRAAPQAAESDTNAHPKNQ